MSTRNPLSSSNLIGTWRLVSAQFAFSDGGERVEMYGAAPTGFLVLTDGGRMMVLITASVRALPSTEADRAALFDSMMSYSGSYRVEGGDRFVTSVDAAWHPSWEGTQQTRFFHFDGDTLALATTPLEHPLYPGRSGRGLVDWRRVA